MHLCFFLLLCCANAESKKLKAFLKRIIKWSKIEADSKKESYLQRFLFISIIWIVSTRNNEPWLNEQYLFFSFSFIFFSYLSFSFLFYLFFSFCVLFSFVVVVHVSQTIKTFVQPCLRFTFFRKRVEQPLSLCNIKSMLNQVKATNNDS